MESQNEPMQRQGESALTSFSQETYERYLRCNQDIIKDVSQFEPFIGYSLHWQFSQEATEFGAENEA